MFIGIGMPLPDLANLPGPSRPGGGGGIVDPVPFKAKVAVTSGQEKTFKISRLSKTVAGDVTIDWGDGTIEQITGSNNIDNVTHVYNSGNVGTTNNPTVSIGKDGDVGIIGGYYWNLSFLGQPSNTDFLEIQQWGTAPISTTLNFSQSQSLQLTATDKPTLNAGASLSSTFSGCTVFTGNETMKTWDVTNVTNISSMFRDSPKFNVSALDWDVSGVTSFSTMFYNAASNASNKGSFNGRLDNWDFKPATTLSNFMHGQAFNNNSVNTWDVSTIQLFSSSFRFCENFNQDLNNWDVSSATNIASMFNDTEMNGDISNWVTDNVTNMSNLFRASSLDVNNAGINTNGIYWNTGNVTNMSLMFYGIQQQIPSISNWDTSKVANFSNFGATAAAGFNPDIESWDIGGGTNFSSMFNAVSGFNKDLSSWDVSNGTIFQNMLSTTASNFEIGQWDMSSATTAYRVLLFANSFNQNASDMIIGANITRLDFFFYANANLGINAINFTDTIVGWAVQVYDNSAPFNVNAANITLNVDLIDARTSDNASGQTYAAKYGAKWTATGWTNAGDALTFLTTPTASNGAGWTYST